MKPYTTLLTLALGLSAMTAFAQEEAEPPARPEPPPRWAAPQPDDEAERPVRRRRLQNPDAERPAGEVRSERRGARRPPAWSDDSERPERPGRAARRGPAWGTQGPGRGPAFADRRPGYGPGPRQQFSNQDRNGVCPQCGCPGCGPVQSRRGLAAREPGWGPGPQERGAGRGGPPRRN